MPGARNATHIPRSGVLNRHTTPCHAETQTHAPDNVNVNGKTIFTPQTAAPAAAQAPAKGPDPLSRKGSRALDRSVKLCHRRRWHLGQKCDERFMKATRLMGVSHREQGIPSRP